MPGRRLEEDTSDIEVLLYVDGITSVTAGTFWSSHKEALWDRPVDTYQRLLMFKETLKSDTLSG